MLQIQQVPFAHPQVYSRLRREERKRKKGEREREPGTEEKQRSGSVYLLAFFSRVRGPLDGLF